MIMNREFGTISALKTLGYLGKCSCQCDCDELPCPLLSWLCGQLQQHYPELKGDGGGLLLTAELKSILKDLSSPLTDLTFDDKSTLNKITDYLISELQAAVINKYKDINSDEKETEEEPPKGQRCVDLKPEECCLENQDVTEFTSANNRAEWMLVLKTLNMNTDACIDDVLKEVQMRITNLPSDAISPLLSTSLSPEQWVKLKKINDVLSSDYTFRRKMMIKRFQVTLESFAWGDKDKERTKALEMIPPITSLNGNSNVDMPLVLAARVDQSYMEPIRPGKTTTVYKVKMGAVPDRGGRPGEIEPPMPSWENRRAGGGQRSGRGGGSHKGRRLGEKKKKKH